jgi:hypothetical protein
MFLNGCDDGDLIQEDIILKMQPHKMLIIT